jgi:hypothetical protein
MIKLASFSWGQAPKPPWFRFAEGLERRMLTSAKQNNAFCFFFLKKKNTTRPIVPLGASLQTPVVPLRGTVGQEAIFCEAEQRFLLLFLEKEEYQITQIVQK